MIILASDHAGFLLKEKIKRWLTKTGNQFFDCGAENLDIDDSYVDYAKKGIDYYLKNCDIQNDKLILICGSGVGMSIVANRNPQIFAVLAQTKKQAKQAREHNNANCLCLGARNVCFCSTKRMIKTFLATSFLGGKYLDRMNSIK